MLDRLRGRLRAPLGLVRPGARPAHADQQPARREAGGAVASRSADEYRAVLESAVEEYERPSRLIEAMLFRRAPTIQGGHRAALVGLSRLLECSCGYRDARRGEASCCRSAAGPEPARSRFSRWRAVRARVGNLDQQRCATHRAAAHGGGVDAAPRSRRQRVARSVQRRPGDRARAPRATLRAQLPSASMVRVLAQPPTRGWGLAIVKSIMELHGGWVVHSAPGRGR